MNDEILNEMEDGQDMEDGEGIDTALVDMNQGNVDFDFLDSLVVGDEDE